MTAGELVALRTQLQIEEGTRLLPYTDTRGKITIGTGRNLTDRGISPDEAELLLTNDITTAAQGLAKRVPWFVALDPVRQRALVNMAFNLGVSGLLEFTGMLSALKIGDFSTAAAEMLDSQWAKEVPTRAARLAQIVLTGHES